MSTSLAQPLKTLGLRHVALFCQNLSACVEFYTTILGMQLEWQPDANNYYLTSGSDNLALHRASASFNPSTAQFLDHIGFILQTPDTVDEWYNFMVSQKVTINTKPRTHRDGARSFYCQDPDGRVVQMIYHPPISETK